MSLVYTAIVPHPPIIIAEIGGDQILAVRGTISSMKKIAESLKASRAMLKEEKRIPEMASAHQPETRQTKIEIPVPDYFRYEDEQTKDLSLEEKSRLYIRQKKYSEAIEILRQLNLINPKKSIYFADQIRFLEKIIANSK